MSKMPENPTPGITELEKIFNQYKSRLESAEHDSTEVIDRARQKADSLIAEAQKRAGQITGEVDRKAQVEADKILTEAKLKAEQILKDTDHVVKKEARERSKREVDKILAEAKQASEKQLNEMLAQAKKEADQIIKEVKDTARAEAQKESDRIIGEATARAKKIDADAIARLNVTDQTLVTITQKVDGILDRSRARVQAEFAELVMAIAKAKVQFARNEPAEAVPAKAIEKAAETVPFQARRELRIVRPYDEVRLRRLVEFLKQVPNIRLAGEAGTENSLSIYVDMLQPLPLLTILRDMSLVESSEVQGDTINLRLTAVPSGSR